MKFLRNDLVVSFFILAAYLLTNSYVFGWDDQHLEIPLLKHLIDPSLYGGDYYVQSLAANFSSYLYPLLAKVISIQSIPAVYLALFLIARYAMFYWVYRFWQLVSGEKFAAFCATLALFLLGRTEEFLYRTFSHQEFSYIFVFAGIYLFYRERYLWAALIFGLGANIHAIYNLFPMLYMLTFLLIFHPKRISMALKTGLVFILAALPFLLWQIPRSMAASAGGQAPTPEEWIPLDMLACPQNFLFGDTPLPKVLGNIHVLFLKLTPFLFLTALYIFHLVFNPLLRRDKKFHAVIFLSWVIIGASYYFHYVHPSRLVVDLNLVRVEQFVRFWLMGYTVIWALTQAREQKPFLALAAALLFVAAGVYDLVGLVAVLFVSAIWTAVHLVKERPGVVLTTVLLISVVLLGAGGYFLAMEARHYPVMPLLWQKFKYVVWFLVVWSCFLSWKSSSLWLRRILIIAPLLWLFGHFCNYHYNYLKLRAHGGGFWQMQRNWEDMQNYARTHTPKDAFLLTPYNTDVGGFRIRSERKVLVCYRDCGLVGFDYQAALEWHRRVLDIEAFKLYADTPVDQAVARAVLKYKVDYIVFMNYYAPKEDHPILEKMYQNEVFSLYKVKMKLP